MKAVLCSRRPQVGDYVVSEYDPQTGMSWLRGVCVSSRGPVFDDITREMLAPGNIRVRVVRADDIGMWQGWMAGKRRWTVQGLTVPHERVRRVLVLNDKGEVVKVTTRAIERLMGFGKPNPNVAQQVAGAAPRNNRGNGRRRPAIAVRRRRRIQGVFVGAPPALRDDR